MYRFQEIKADAKLRDTLCGTTEVRRLMREWFTKNNFLEVKTPSLVRAPGQEPYLHPFELAARSERHEITPAYLITSPEYALKKLLAAGFSKVFDLAPVFRNNEPADALHNPEFTMLEWYRAGTDYRGIMEDCEQLVSFVAKKLPTANPPLPITFEPPWERLSVCEAFQKYADIHLDKALDRKDFDMWFFKMFLTHIEPKLGQKKPTILYDYPASMASLAKKKSDDPRYAERFEVYMKGVEIANAFSELTDPVEQRARFLAEQEVRHAEGKSVHPLDEEFLAAVGALPACGGIALGVDRLAMILLDAKSIRDVLFFPW